MIHSAIALPMPPAPARPWAQKAQATQKPLTEVGPSRNSPSGVKPSGPLSSWIDLGRFDRRDALDGVLHQRGEALPVGGQELVLEIARDAVQPERGRVALVPARDEPADLLAPVDQQVGVAQGREVVPHSLDRLGDDVEVRHGDDGQGQPDHLADLAAPLPGGVHHDLGLDRALVGDHVVDAAVLQVDLLHVRVREDARPA